MILRQQCYRSITPWLHHNTHRHGSRSIQVHCNHMNRPLTRIGPSFTCSQALTRYWWVGVKGRVLISIDGVVVPVLNWSDCKLETRKQAAWHLKFQRKQDCRSSTLPYLYPSCRQLASVGSSARRRVRRWQRYVCLGFLQSSRRISSNLVLQVCPGNGIDTRGAWGCHKPGLHTAGRRSGAGQHICPRPRRMWRGRRRRVLRGRRRGERRARGSGGWLQQQGNARPCLFWHRKATVSCNEWMRQIGLFCACSHVITSHETLASFI